MSMEQRESFVFYRSFFEAISELSEGDRSIIYHAIASYALDREEAELVGVPKLAWILIKPQLDANWRKYDKGCRGSEAGKKGGRPRKNPIGDILETANDNDNDNDNVNDNVNDLQTSMPPLLSEVTTFISEKKLDVDAQYFYDYYTSNGWMIGKTPMMDWRATLRNWDRKTEKNNQTQTLQITLSNDL